MKKILSPLAMCLMAGLLFTNCKDEKKDDPVNNDPTVNEITIGDKKYTIQNVGVLDYFGKDNGTDPDFQYDGYNFDLILLDQNIKLTLDSQGRIDTATGSGLMIYFEAFSPDSTKLADGTYTFDNNSPFAVKTFDYADYTTTWSPNDSTSIYPEVENGSFTVSSSGSTYTILLDLTDENNQKITGTFKGTFIME